MAALTTDLNAMNFFEDEDSMDQALHQLKMLKFGSLKPEMLKQHNVLFPWFPPVHSCDKFRG